MKDFVVPHYHVILGHGYDVWTYALDRHYAYMPYRLRQKATELQRAGEYTHIVTCDTPSCLIYIPDSRGRLLEEDTHARIDSIRLARRRLQDDQAPQDPQRAGGRTSWGW